jgi:molybdopterin-guanine dinucleotide biosynthesis protein A
LSGNRSVSFAPDESIFGAVLIGGASSRMGRSKQNLVIEGRTMSEVAVEALEGVVERVVIAGAGPVSRTLRRLERVADVVGVSGPMAGVLAVMRWAPSAAWVVVACDMPQVSPAAVRWLIDQRGPGVQAVLPRLRERGVETLLALYEPAALHALEELAAADRWALHRLVGRPGVVCPIPPPDLAPAWKNVNTPEQFRAFRDLVVS